MSHIAAIQDVRVSKHGRQVMMRYMEGTHLLTETLISEELESGVRLQGWARVKLSGMGYRAASWDWDSSAQEYRIVVAPK